MKITDLNGKAICILGFGKEGHAALEALRKHASSATITIADKNASIEVPVGIATQTGDDWLKDLTRFDVIIKSPGIPPRDLPAASRSFRP